MVMFNYRFLSEGRKKVKKEWDGNFPTVEVTYDIKGFSRRPGFSTTPQGLPKEKGKKK